MDARLPKKNLVLTRVSACSFLFILASPSMQYVTCAAQVPLVGPTKTKSGPRRRRYASRHAKQLHTTIQILQTVKRAAYVPCKISKLPFQCFVLLGEY